MEVTLILSMILFIWIGAVTPGPVNLVSVSSGVTYGWIKTWPFVAGASVAYLTVVFSTGIGLSRLLLTIPAIKALLVWLGAAYLLYIAFKMASAKPSELQLQALNSPPSFMQGALMQWLNPKAWIIASSGIGLFVTSEPNTSTALMVFCIVALTFCIIGVGTWMILGQLLGHLLSKLIHQVWLNRGMAALLCIITIPMIMSQ
jgi:threonine/homoserine/homoserine lactone efflux protein